jgi:acetyltransferase-like isoleucine patch superfamily enzyme
VCNLKEIVYILDKVRFSFLRGFFIFPFLARKSKIPLIGRNVRIMASWNLKTGKRNYIGDNSYIECYCKEKVSFGNHVTLRENAWIQCRSGFNELSEGLIIENNVYIGPGAIIGVGGKVVIEEGCQIGARLAISAESHEINENNHNYVSGEVSRKGIKIGKNTWIGNNVTILDGVNIGENCVIGAGTIVTKSIANNSVVVGNPARIIKKIN